MRRALLIAAREYRQVTGTRGFWVLLLTLPLVLVLTQVVGRLTKPDATSAYVLVDASGRYGRAIQDRLEVDHQRDVLSDLATYVRRWAHQPGKGALWDSGARGFDDNEVQAFIAAGGLPHALSEIKPRLGDDAPPFHTDPSPYLPAEDQALRAGQSADAFAVAAKATLGQKVATSAGPRRLTMAIYVPKDFGPSGPPVLVWARDDPNDDLIKVVRRELTGALRLEALTAAGLPAAEYARINRVNAPLSITIPAKDHTATQLLERSALPLALAYLLLIAVMTTGGMMLQGLIEERSNKLLESVLACVTPSELMYGKLLGLGGVGFTTLIAWIACAAFAALSMPGLVADVLRPSLESATHSWMAAAMIFYFVTGYMIVSVIYLAIGSLSDSMQDAQSYLMPVVMLIMLPIFFMMTSVVRDPSSALPHILSWIPLYTPFAMLVRLGSGVSWMEVLGTSVMLLAFTSLEMIAAGRIFQASLLRTGQALKLRTLWGLIIRPGVD